MNAEETEENKKLKKGNWPAAFFLVVIMLVILGILVFFLLIMPTKDNIEYYKWALSLLVGAFGAWIGAGAAYFFGKENLQESSRSTEEALRIQQELMRRPPMPERIKDMDLVAMNRNFIFELEAERKDVVAKLELFRGYWFVPVVDKDTKKLLDVIQARAFWDTKVVGNTIQEMITEMDKDPSLKKLHGKSSFYVTTQPSEKISDVYEELNKAGAEVVIVVDEKDIPNHCLSKTELRTILHVSD